MTEPNGVLLINKPEDWTSHDIVNKVRRLYNTKKVGHTGTLDPMATGLLVVLVGRAAKAAEYLVSDSKRYVAGIKFGLTTDTQDITGELLTQSDSIPSQAQVEAAVRCFEGDIIQIPPMYSALKINGQKLVDLARKNITVEREGRQIHIDKITCEQVDKRTYTLGVDCSKGTYIRTLCADIGERLGCGAVMSSLRREISGNFSLENAHTIDEIAEMSEEERLSLLMPTEGLFAELETVVLPEFYERLCRNGAEIYQKKIKTRFEIGQKLRIYGKNGFFALGEVQEFDDGTAIKAIKLFEL